jgi:hypothetical protein
VMELQAAVSVLTTLCLSDGDCGGGGKGVAIGILQNCSCCA